MSSLQIIKKLATVLSNLFNVVLECVNRYLVQITQATNQFLLVRLG